MRRTSSIPKPAHLAARYGDQFQDVGVARAYSTRPPYSPEFFAVLDGLHAPGQQKILELGSGSGDVTLGLLGRAVRIDAIEPSAAMLSIAQQRPHSGHPSIRWICASAEDAAFEGPYSLALAAESLHWMEWEVVLPKIAAALAPDAVLVVAERGLAAPVPWHDELGRLISRYSTN